MQFSLDGHSNVKSAGRVALRGRNGILFREQQFSLTISGIRCLAVLGDRLAVEQTVELLMVMLTIISSSGRASFADDWADSFGDCMVQRLMRAGHEKDSKRIWIQNLISNTGGQGSRVEMSIMTMAD